MEITQQTVIGFIGAGNMAEAIMRGIVSSHIVPAERVLIYDVRPPHSENLKKDLGVRVAADNRQIMAEADIVLLAVKPQGLKTVLTEVQGCARENQVVISVLAGVRSETLERGFAHDACPQPRVVRVMPNTPALVRMGATALAKGAHTTASDLDTARRIFDAVGVTEIVNPDLMDAITGLTGTGPAYVFHLVEALVDAGVAQGLDRETSENLVKQMVLGSATMAKDSKVSPTELRRRVTSPGGTTAAAFVVLYEHNFMGLMREAVDAAAKRSSELGAATDKDH